MSADIVYGSVLTDVIGTITQGNNGRGVHIDVDALAGNKIDVLWCVSFDGTVTGKVDLALHLNLAHGTNQQNGITEAWVRAHSEPVTTAASAFRTPAMSLAYFSNGILPAGFRMQVSNNANASITNVTLEYRTVTQQDV